MSNIKIKTQIIDFYKIIYCKFIRLLTSKQINYENEFYPPPIFFKIVSVLFLFSLFLVSCEKDELGTKDDTNGNQLIEKFRNDFDSKQFAEKLRYKYQVDWSKPVKQYSEQLQASFYEFPIIYADAYNPDVFNEQIKRDFYEKYKVVAIEKKEGNFEFCIAKYFLKNTERNTNISSKMLSLTVNKGYEGTVHLYDKDANLIFAKHVNSTNETNKFYSINKKSKESTQAKWIKVCKTVTIYHCTDWFRVYYDAYGNIIQSIYLYTTINSTTTSKECHDEWSPDPIIPKTPCTPSECNGVYYAYDPGIACPQGYKDDGFGNCEAMPTLQVADDLDVIIIDDSFANNPCLMGVYDKLGGSTTFQKYLTRFDGDFSVANLKLSVGINPNHPLANAVTTGPQHYLIETMFNPNNLSRPQLDIARTFIHEMLHAEIFRKLLSVAGQKDIPWTADFINSIKDDYPGIADYYIRYKFNIPQGQLPSDAQHELMSTNYRNIIIQVMQQFDSTQSADVYNALSWIGLMGSGHISGTTGLPINPTIAWKNLPQTERLEILAIWNNFKDTNTPCQ